MSPPLLMDEPLTVIDPQLKFDIRRKLKTINELYGLTMVYVTHDQNEAMTFADTIVVMNHGEVIQVGTPEDLHNKPQTTYVGYFIGSPAMNFIHCSLGDDCLKTECGSIAIPRGLNVPKDTANLKAGIRPRYPRLVKSPGKHGLKVRVRLVQEFGNYRVVTLAAGQEVLRLKLTGDTEIPADEAWVEFPPERVCLYHDDVLVEGP